MGEIADWMVEQYTSGRWGQPHYPKGKRKPKPKETMTEYADRQVKNMTKQTKKLNKGIIEW